MAKDPFRYFRIEARELLEQLGRGILDLEKEAGDAQIVARLLRLAHTLKGAARVVRQREIADHAHAIEEVLAPLREAPAAQQREQVEAVLARLDGIGAALASLAVQEASAVGAGWQALDTSDAADAAEIGGVMSSADSLPPSSPAQRTAPAPAPALRAVPLHVPRPEVAELDALLEGAAALHAQLAALRSQLAPARQLCEPAQLLADQLAPGQAGGAARPGAAHAAAETLRQRAGRLERGLAAPVEQMERDLRQLREGAERLRLVPAAVLFTPLERTARDAARALGKEVCFEGRGGEVRLDAEVLAAVQAPLVQMVRNAVAHGIEPPASRLAAAKPAQGRVTLEVARQGGRVMFRCGDDGAGLDLDALRGAAERSGMPPAAARALDGQALMDRLLRGGLSTAGHVTEVAGRGIGLDVVREAAERLRGETTLQTASGEGTTLSLRVPLSLAAVAAMKVEAGGAAVAIPLEAVRSALRIDLRQQVARGAQGESIVHEGEVLPFVMLARLLQRRSAGHDARQVSAVIVQGADGAAAIGVERLLGTASVVLRALPSLAPASPVVAGASLEADGSAQIVLDADGLVRAARRAGSTAAPPMPEAAAALPVLVIDDSLTTRMLEQSILESAGYEVHTATSAEEGLERARRQRYALFLVDVEMPGMDGFAFVERTRADPALREVPAILVTSRSAPEDRRRGREAGAQGYIVKSEFAQDDFLRRVRQLVRLP